jgi:hypothetical protein
MINIDSEFKRFVLLDWVESPGGGYSKIISLGDELLCILNSKFKYQMILLDINDMVSYDISIFNPKIIHDGFGIAGFPNGFDFIIYGGFQMSGFRVADINKEGIFYHLSFGLTQANERLSPLSMIIVTTAGVLLIMMISITFIYWSRIKTRQNGVQRFGNLHKIREIEAGVYNPDKV